jgi:hypothetical protein
VQCLYDYVLYTGDLALAAQLWPNLVKLLDTWYASNARPDGLVANDFGWKDYAFIGRQGNLIAYYNAGYALALEEGTTIASWLARRDQEKGWQARAMALAAPFNATFWDQTAGAYVDAPTGPAVHPLDGNVFAILAGLTSPSQALSALGYLGTANRRDWGNTIADNNTWYYSDWGPDPMDRAFPFISYFELLARFTNGMDDSALDLIRREWGWMLAHGPTTTMWEDIGPDGIAPRNSDPSWDHGWSSGAAPALTNYVLGASVRRSDLAPLRRPDLAPPLSQAGFDGDLDPRMSSWGEEILHGHVEIEEVSG